MDKIILCELGDGLAMPQTWTGIASYYSVHYLQQQPLGHTISVCPPCGWGL